MNYVDISELNCGAIEEGVLVYSQKIQHMQCGRGWE